MDVGVRRRASKWNLRSHGGVNAIRFIFEELAFHVASCRVIKLVGVFGNNPVTWNDDVIGIFGEALTDSPRCTRVTQERSEFCVSHGITEQYGMKERLTDFAYKESGFGFQMRQKCVGDGFKRKGRYGCRKISVKIALYGIEGRRGCLERIKVCHCFGGRHDTDRSNDIVIEIKLDGDHSVGIEWVFKVTWHE